MGSSRNGIDVDETDLDTLIEHVNHQTKIFPDTTAYLCVLTAHTTAHTWTDWAEIVDSDDPVNTLSAAFASYPGHITGVQVEETSEAGTRFMFQISTTQSEAGSVAIGRVLTETNKLPTVEVARQNGALIAAGSTLYYRTMCATANEQAITVHFRYFLHS